MIYKQQKPNLTAGAQVKLGAEKVICLVSSIIKRGTVERMKVNQYYAFFFYSQHIITFEGTVSVCICSVAEQLVLQGVSQTKICISCVHQSLKKNPSAY